MGLRSITKQEETINKSLRRAAKQKRDKRKPGESMADTEYKIATKPKTKRKNILEKKAMGGKVTKRPMGGKVYKVDNSGQMMVQRMYGGKLGF